MRRKVSMTGETEIISMKKNQDSCQLDGGQPSPVKNHMVLRPNTPEEKKVGMYRETLQAGEAFINFSAGGAGWGDSANRDPSAIAEDVLDGLCRSMSDI